MEQSKFSWRKPREKGYTRPKSLNAVKSLLSIYNEAHRTLNARGVSRGSDIPRCQGCRQFRSSDEAGRNVSCFVHAARMALMDRFIRTGDMAV